MLRETLYGIPMAAPLDERLDWRSFALLVSLDEVPRLHDVLAAVSPARRRRMRRALSKVWPRFLYTQLYGSYLGEDGREDAFETLVQVMRRRVALMAPLPRTVFED